MHALSIPTWIIHIASVLEWIAAIWLIGRYGQVQGDRRWYGLAIAMLPALASALCACTWHFFDNTPDLDWLVTTQAALTLGANGALCLAAWGLWRGTAAADSHEP